MLEIGIVATNLVHPINNIKWLKETYGDKLALIGGFNAQMYCRPDAIEEAILADMEKTFEILAPGTSFVPLCFAIYSKHLPYVGQQLARLANKYHSPRPL